MISISRACDLLTCNHDLCRLIGLIGDITDPGEESPILKRHGGNLVAVLLELRERGLVTLRMLAMLRRIIRRAGRIWEQAQALATRPLPERLAEDLAQPN